MKTTEIYKAINAVSKKVNEMSQKLDSFFNVRADENAENISTNSGAVDDLANVTDINSTALDGLATSLSDIATAIDDIATLTATMEERITNLENGGK